MSSAPCADSPGPTTGTASLCAMSNDGPSGTGEENEGYLSDADLESPYEGVHPDSTDAESSLWPTESEQGPSTAEPYKSPNFVDALRSLFQPRGPRTRAQPATGTEADAKAVNYIDRRERLIASFLSAFQIILGIVVYLHARKYVEHVSKKAKITVAEAHRDTLTTQHAAPELLVINLLLGLAIAAGVFSKRRAFVGFAIILGGFGMSASGGGILGILYLGIGIWLVFRARRRNPTARSAAAETGAANSGAARSAQRAGSSRREAATAAAPAARRPPPPSKRYTPPSARRPAPPKPTATTPEKESRLTSWLRR